MRHTQMTKPTLHLVTKSELKHITGGEAWTGTGSPRARENEDGKTHS